MATLAGLTLMNAGYSPIVYSFGSPRVGNAPFAAYFSKLLVHNYRVTHYKDLFVHLPPHDFGYTHVNTEIYEDRKGHYKVCTETEDPSCADQWALKELNLADHLVYLNRTMMCPV